MRVPYFGLAVAVKTPSFENQSKESSSRHCAPNKERDKTEGGAFPEGFIWCAATASFQIEGAWDEDNRGASIWDDFAHYRGPLLEDDDDPEEFPIDADCTNGKDQCYCMIAECDNGDDACKSYQNLERDISLLVDMNVEMYRFSLSWPRLMPDGVTPNVNTGGLEYYNRLIDQLLANDITPMVTLYHWDLPSALAKGDRLNFDECHGWDCPEIVEQFAAYAEYCFEQFGNRVKHWITLNEPEVFIDEGYWWCEMAPGVCNTEQEARKARHNTVLAHARAYEVYDTKFRHEQNGIIGITLNSEWYHPEDPNNKLDVLASDIAMSLSAGWWAWPIYGHNGDYSELMKETLRNADEWDVAFEFTQEEKARNFNSSDFFGLNHYMSSIVEYKADRDYKYRTMGRCTEWPESGSDWLRPCPWAFRELLKYIDQNWQKPIYVTENGISSSDASNGTDLEPMLNDQFRVKFYEDYIGQMLRAINEDHVNVKAYTAWSLMDNLEWARGYTERFGLHWTNYTDPARTVYRKASGDWYARLARDNCVTGSAFDAEKCAAQVNDEDGAGSGVAPSVECFAFVSMLLLFFN